MQAAAQGCCPGKEGSDFCPGTEICIPQQDQREGCREKGRALICQEKKVIFYHMQPSFKPQPSNKHPSAVLEKKGNRNGEGMMEHKWEQSLQIPTPHLIILKKRCFKTICAFHCNFSALLPFSDCFASCCRKEPAPDGERPNLPGSQYQ